MESSRVIEQDLEQIEHSENYLSQLLAWWSHWRVFQVFECNEAHYKHITGIDDWEDLISLVLDENLEDSIAKWQRENEVDDSTPVGIQPCLRMGTNTQAVKKSVDWKQPIHEVCTFVPDEEHAAEMREEHRKIQVQLQNYRRSRDQSTQAQTAGTKVNRAPLISAMNSSDIQASHLENEFDEDASRIRLSEIYGPLPVMDDRHTDMTSRSPLATEPNQDWFTIRNSSFDNMPTFHSQLNRPLTASSTTYDNRRPNSSHNYEAPDASTPASTTTSRVVRDYTLDFVVETPLVNTRDSAVEHWNRMAEALQTSQASSNEANEISRTSAMLRGDIQNSITADNEMLTLAKSSSSHRRQRRRDNHDDTATSSAFTLTRPAWVRKVNAISAARKSREPLTLHGIIPERPILKRPKYCLDIDWDNVRADKASTMRRSEGP